MSTFTIYAKGPRALMFSDTAAVDSEGVVRAWMSKVITIPHLRMAITTRGAMVALSDLVIDLAARFSSFDEMVTAEGERFLAEAHEHYLMKWSDLAGTPEFDLALVGWSTGRRQCEAHAISSREHPGFPPFTFRRNAMLVTPAPAIEELEAAGLMRNGRFVPMEPRDLLSPLIELQRRTLAPLGGTPGAPECYIVGGQVVQTEITESGISQRIVRTWPDRLGERIQPEALPSRNAAPSAPAGMSRQQRRAAEKLAKKGQAHAA